MLLYSNIVLKYSSQINSNWKRVIIYPPGCKSKQILMVILQIVEFFHQFCRVKCIWKVHMFIIWRKIWHVTWRHITTEQRWKMKLYFKLFLKVYCYLKFLFTFSFLFFGCQGLYWKTESFFWTFNQLNNLLSSRASK